MKHKELIDQLAEIRTERQEWGEHDSCYEKDVRALDEAIGIIAKDYVFSDTQEELHPIPPHYQIKDLTQDTMDVIEAIVRHNCSDVLEACMLFSTLKYLFRFGKKDGSKDLRKAIDFLTRLIEKIEVKE